MPVNSLGSLSAEQKYFIDRKMLLRAQKSQVFYPWAYTTAVPQHGGNSVSFRRLEALSLATTALTEGVAGASAGLTVTEVTTSVSQYGNFALLTDQLNYLGVDDLLSEAALVFSQNGGESIDSVISTVLGNGTNIIYANGSSKGSIGTSNVLTNSLLRYGVETLETANAQKFGGDPQDDMIGVGGFVAFVHPHQVYDLYSDAENKSAFQYSSFTNNDDSKIWTGHVKSIYGVELFKSTLCPVFAGAGSASANVYATVLIAKQAFGCLDVAGLGKFQTFSQGFGSGGATGDPLYQQASIGWKAFQSPVILNQNFMVVILTGATHG